jgi:hypothetical protein
MAKTTKPEAPANDAPAPAQAAAPATEAAPAPAEAAPPAPPEAQPAADADGAPPEMPIGAMDAEDFILDWLADVPPEAANGSYGTSVRDRWADRIYAFSDGTHTADIAEGWAFTFAGGRFIGAVLTPPPADQPAEAEAAA